ncbi:hypothetical protein PSHT_10516 [Puccinia striiformis]|uniref:Uncharacterized protein n=1 Tax=Puccinia striiformis TaxID=27350 RepID=A0A2S4V9G0_9BASI|nr:hypothetical protein PSHT_10516 [Puccinia striiformis]
MQPFNFNSDKSLLGSGCPPNTYTPSLKQTSSYIHIRPIKALPRREDQPTRSGVQSSDFKPTINQQFVIDWGSFRPNSDLPPLILGRNATVPTRDTRTSNPTFSNLQPASKSRAQQQVIPQQQSSSQDCNSGRSHLGFFKLKLMMVNGRQTKTWLIPLMRTTLPGIKEEKSTLEANYQSSSPNLRADINFPEIPEIESDLDVNENFPVLCSAWILYLNSLTEA